MPCTDPMLRMLEPFRPVFTAPTWKKMLTRLERNPSGTRAPHRHRRFVANRPKA